jgi:hypothetical protein
MIIGIAVLVLVVTGFLTWVFWEHDFDGAFVVAICALAVELIVAVVAGPSYLIGSYTCSKVAEKMEVEHDYGFFTGCFIRDENGRWYNYSQQRVVK